MTDSTQIQAAADAAREDAERHGHEAERLSALRRQALLTGDDTALERIEAALTVAGRERERALLKAEALEEQAAHAAQAARAKAKAADRREVEELCRGRLKLAAEIDRLVAELAPVAREWRSLGLRLHALWLTRDLQKELGAIRPSMQPDDHVCLRACLPSDLMIELGGRPGPGTPLVETDPAKVALAKLEAGMPIQAQPQTSRQERDSRPTVTHLDDAAGVRVVDPAA